MKKKILSLFVLLSLLCTPMYASASSISIEEALSFDELSDVQIIDLDSVEILNINQSISSLPSKFLEKNTLNNNAEDNIKLNSIYALPLEPYWGYVLRYTPPVNGFYTAETFYGSGSNNAQSIIFAQNLNSGQEWSDINSGTGSNAAVGFTGYKGQQMEFQVYGAPGSKSGTVYFQVRRHRMQIYTFSDPGEPANRDDVAATHARDAMVNYDAMWNKAQPASHITTTDSSNWPRIYSEIFYYLGHGAEGLLAFQLDGKSALAYDSLGPDVLRDTKLCVLGSCRGAARVDGKVGTSMTEAMNDAGARTVLGWVDDLPIVEGKSWLYYFWDGVASSLTVKEAADAATRSLTFPSTKVKSWSIRGDADKVINLEIVKPKSTVVASQLNKDILKQYTADQNTFNYESMDLGGGWTRCYKTIDGYLTNDFYDIKTDSVGNPVEISKSFVTISEEEIKYQLMKKLKLNSVEMPNYIERISNDKLENYDTVIVYYKSDNEIIPIAINYCTFKDEADTLFCKEICINLNTGDYIDYENFVLIN